METKESRIAKKKASLTSPLLINLTEEEARELIVEAQFEGEHEVSFIYESTEDCSLALLDGVYTVPELKAIIWWLTYGRDLKKPV